MRVIQASLGISGTLLLFLPLVRSIPLLFGLIFLWAMAAESVRPASLAAVVATTPAEYRKAAIALNRLAVNLGMSIGPAVGGFLAMTSFAYLFVVDGLTSLAAALLAASVHRRVAPRQPPAPVARGFGRSVLTDHRMRAFLLAFFFVELVFFQIEGPLSLFVVRDLGKSTSFFGLLFVVNTVLILLLEVPLNLAMSGWPHRRALLLGSTLLTGASASFALARGSASLIFVVVVWTLGEMILLPASGAYAADLAPEAHRGEYVGAYFMVASLGFMFGPVLGLSFMERFGAVALWTAVGACGLVGAALFGLTTGPGRHRLEPLEDARRG